MQKTILAVFAFLTLAGTAFGAGTEQKYGFSPDAFEIKYFVQPRWSYFADSLYSTNDDELKGVDNGFSVRRSRVYLTSNVTPNVKGRVQFEVKPEKVEVIDAYADWSIPIQGKLPLTFRLGQYKKPVSYQEYVMTSSDLNLIDRTYTNAFLEKKLFVSAEDQGIMAIGDLWEYNIPVMLHLGVFNGNGKGQKSDNNSGKQFAGRLEVTPVTGLSLGGSLEANQLGAADTLETYTVWGGEAVFAKKGFQVVAEAFGGDNNEKVLAKGWTSLPVPTFFAWYAEAIYRAPGGWEPAARIELFDPDTDKDKDGRTLVTGQLAYSFSKNFRWQVNVIHEIFQDDTVDSRTDVVSQWTIRL